MKFSLHFSLALTLVSVLAACSSLQVQPEKLSSDTASAKKLVATPLTETEASERSEAISQVSYALTFHLDDQRESFSGTTQIRFNLNGSVRSRARDLFIDFYDGEIDSMQLNGASLSDPKKTSRYDGNRIYLKIAELSTGPNALEINFHHTYSGNGHGLHHFKDPVDQAVYLYSDLEPYFAHHIFPCFDQPDLKATFQLTVDAPSAWQVVSNTRESKITPLRQNKKEWIFPPTPKMSTYVVALVAGEYKGVTAQANGIPMRLFSRKSLARYLDSNEWFNVTRKGLKFYGSQFAKPYPFLKYDQILVPEFNEGAMENIGAVTFSERMLYRTKETRLTHERRANVILHEMAHMWFGDLVTMKWWNGLWLNESFATFMAAWAMSETHPIAGTGKNNSWESFVDEKAWAYYQDQLVTTHPIELPVPDTDHAFSNFDGITYGKGAAVIQQLHYSLGDSNFKKGIQNYFKKYAYQNTRLEDFIGSLAEASSIDLSNWKSAWLMTSGVNTLKTDWECTDGKISKLNLLQLPAENSSVLRPHRTVMGFYRNHSPEGIVVSSRLPVRYDSSLTSIDEVIGQACPDFLFPNASDEDYVKVELDSKTLSEISNHLTEIKDLRLKKMLWHSLGEMVTDGKLSAKQFSDLVLMQLPTEKNSEILQTALQVLGKNIPEYMNQVLRAEYYEKFEALTLAGMNRSRAGSDVQLLWFQFFVEFAHSHSGTQRLRAILEGKIKIPKLKIDQDVRWTLVQALARRGAPDAEVLINRESKADLTEIGKKSALAAQVGRPEPTLKAKWADVIFAAAASGSYQAWNSSDIQTLMSDFNVLGQESLTETQFERYFQFLPEAVKSPDENYVQAYTSSFFPSLCSERVLEFTTEALKLKLPITAEKNQKVMKQETERCIRARKLI